MQGTHLRVEILISGAVASKLQRCLGGNLPRLTPRKAPSLPFDNTALSTNMQPIITFVFLNASKLQILACFYPEVANCQDSRISTLSTSMQPIITFYFHLQSSNFSMYLKAQSHLSMA
jgi:hypothetical protein